MISIVVEQVDHLKKHKSAYTRGIGTVAGLGGGALLLRSIAHAHQEDFHTDEQEHHEKEHKELKKAGLHKAAESHKRSAEHHEKQANESERKSKAFGAAALGVGGTAIGTQLYSDIKDKPSKQR